MVAHLACWDLGASNAKVCGSDDYNVHVSIYKVLLLRKQHQAKTKSSIKLHLDQPSFGSTTLDINELQL
jgi:hypothetical protein